MRDRVAELEAMVLRLSDEAARAAQVEARLRETIAANERLLQQRAMLLDEVNHRAKNSLQMAVGLLDMQARRAGDARVAGALGEAIQRLNQFARVHEMLYRHSSDAQTVDVASLLADLAGALRAAHGLPAVEIVADSDPLTLDAGRATSLALVAGEASINALKHAFPHGRAGRIAIGCRRLDACRCRLEVADDGTGSAKAARQGSLGMKLMRALAKTLGGELAVDAAPGEGVRVRVDFPA